MHYTLHSTNLNLLSIINKNPSSNFGMFLKTFGEGVIVGHCISENEYEVSFHEGRKNSFPKDEQSQIDFMQFCSPQILLGTINTLFSELIKEKNVVNSKTINWLNSKTIKELDGEEFLTTITIPSIYIDGSWAKGDEFLLAKYFPQIKNFKNKIGNIYSFEIQCNSIVESINMLSFVSMMIAVTNKQYFVTNDDIIKKYLRILKNVDSIPYFVLYLFKVRILNDEYRFNAHGKELESISKEPLKMTWGNTHQQRINVILPNISFERNVVDFGCGELIYAKKILPKLKEGLKYFAIDVDEDVADHISKIKDRFKNEIIGYYDIPSNEVLNEDFEVIMTEVLEHVGIEKGKEIIETFLNNPFCKKIIVTTPNKDFNIYYLMGDDEVRRYDHLIEMNQLDFQNFFSYIKFRSNSKIKAYSLYIGDEYLGITPTQGFIIEKI